jgi:deazaflavin-dependent oxidoreductase (nitroreductase family)
VSDWNTSIIKEFRENHGKVGGNFEGAPLLLLHTTGAVTKAERVHPMVYLQEGERLFVFASKAGAPAHPHWFLNLVKHPSVTVEKGTETFAATAQPVTGDERDRIYAKQAGLMPGFADYQS